MNSLIDEGVNLEAEEIKDVPDHYIYELSQHMPLEELASKYRGTTVADIQAIIRRHVDKMFELEQYMQQSEANLQQTKSENIELV